VLVLGCGGRCFFARSLLVVLLLVVMVAMAMGVWLSSFVLGYVGSHDRLLDIKRELHVILFWSP
jgi:hypothetical protein